MAAVSCHHDDLDLGVVCWLLRPSVGDFGDEMELSGDMAWAWGSKSWNSL